MLSILPEAIFITWVYNNTNRSILGAILFHFVTNFNPIEEIFANQKAGAEYFPADEVLWLLFVLRFVAAGIIVLIWGPKDLSRTPVSQNPVETPGDR
jgi:membrane protease YdiL (CAAX protease family)